MPMNDEAVADLIRKLNETYTGEALQKVMVKTGPTTIMCPCCFQPTPLESAVKMADKHFGGMLECNICLRKQPMDSASFKLAFEHAWPQCCGKQMVWKTRHEINKEIA